MPISTLVCTLLAYAGPSLDIQVDGAGLLRFARAGRAVYAKKASLTVASGHLTAAGCDLLPAVSVPSDAVSIDVDLEGNLYAVRSATKAKIGKLVLAMFPNEDALTADGKFLIAQDRPSLGEAGQQTFGVIRRAEVASHSGTSGLAPITPIKHPTSRTPAPEIVSQATDRPSNSQPDGEEVVTVSDKQLNTRSIILHTANPLDVAIQGDGFFRLRLPDGSDAYTRNGHFKRNETGLVVTSEGYSLNPEFTIPAGSTSISVAPDGLVSALLPGSTEPSTIGEITVTCFADASRLVRRGKNLYAASTASGPGTVGAPGANGCGTLAAGFLEVSFSANPGTAAQKIQVPSQPKAKTTLAPYRANQKIKPVDLPVITIHVSSESKGDKILLGDIADIAADPQSKESLESIPIGDTPTIGVDRGLDAISITSGLARGGWKLGSYVLNMATGAKVRRQCQLIEDDKFVQAAIDAAKSQLKILAALHNDIAQPAMSCQLGEVSLKAESCNKAGSDITVNVVLYVDGHRFNSRLVHLAVDKDAVEVRSGQLVKILAHAAGATVELSGKAKSQAWAGQQITVETETGALLTGTVNQDGVIEVSL